MTFKVALFSSKIWTTVQHLSYYFCSLICDQSKVTKLIIKWLSRSIVLSINQGLFWKEKTKGFRCNTISESRGVPQASQKKQEGQRNALSLRLDFK